MAGRRFLITGGSRGLGLAFCRHYAESGARVFACARAATEEVKALQEAHADRLIFREIDLLVPGTAAELAAEAAERLGAIDVLINNAAVGQDALLAHTSEAEISAIVQLNLTVAIQLTRHVVRRMLLAGGGAILNVSSICGLRGYSGLAVYSATKGGLDAFTRSLARELGGSGIRVNSVAPGFFESEMSSVLAPAQLDAIRRRTPTGALTTPGQVVRACDVLIAHDANVTGQVLVVDGGASIA